MEMEMKRYSSCRSIIHGIHMYTCAHDHLYSHIYTRFRPRLFLFTRPWAVGKVEIYSLGGEGETGGQCGKQMERSDLHSLPGNGYSTQRDGKGSLLRTNTTRPSKCDRTANTVGGGGGGDWEKRELVCRTEGGDD